MHLSSHITGMLEACYIGLVTYKHIAGEEELNWKKYTVVYNVKI
jgi:hypothetical protein